MGCEIREAVLAETYRLTFLSQDQRMVADFFADPMYAASAHPLSVSTPNKVR
jgi:hypothetical protein